MKNVKEKLQNEKILLDAKLERLTSFVEKGKPSFLTDEDYELLLNQKSVMTDYSAILGKRINLLSDEGDSSKGLVVIGNFNHNANKDVEEFKALAREFVELTELKGNDHRRKAIAVTKMEEAQMFAVKSLFH